MDGARSWTSAAQMTLVLDGLNAKILDDCSANSVPLIDVGMSSSHISLSNWSAQQVGPPFREGGGDRRGGSAIMRTDVVLT